VPWCRDSVVNEKHLLNERHTKQEAKKFVLNNQWPRLKPLLTLNRHTCKSKEESAAAMTLLDLSSEPAANSGELDEESIQEFEPEERTDDFPETIESQINRYTDEKVLKDYSP